MGRSHTFHGQFLLLSRFSLWPAHKRYLLLWVCQDKIVKEYQGVPIMWWGNTPLLHEYDSCYNSNKIQTLPPAECGNKSGQSRFKSMIYLTGGILLQNWDSSETENMIPPPLIRFGILAPLPSRTLKEASLYLVSFCHLNQPLQHRHHHCYWLFQNQICEEDPTQGAGEFCYDLEQGNVFPLASARHLCQDEQRW